MNQIERIESFAQLEKCWADTDDSGPLSERVISAAKDYLQKCRPVPTAEGGIVMEHFLGNDYKDCLRVEFDKDGRVIDVLLFRDCKIVRREGDFGTIGNETTRAE